MPFVVSWMVSIASATTQRLQRLARKSATIPQPYSDLVDLEKRVLLLNQLRLERRAAQWQGIDDLLADLRGSVEPSYEPSYERSDAAA